MIIKRYLDKVFSYRESLLVGDPELEENCDADIFVISHPKSGRTWLRFMLAKYIAEILEDDFEVYKDVTELLNSSKISTKIAFAHDFSSITNHKKRIKFSASKLPRDKSIYKNKKVILLVRDLRDVMVSYFFDCTQRNCVYSGEISDFIKDEYFGISKAVNFLNYWYESRKIPKDFMIIKYEDIQRNALGELLKVIDYSGLPYDQEAAKVAVGYGDFNNMKNLERQGQLDKDQRFGAKEKNSKQAFKVRKGKIFGFKDDLCVDDIKYLSDYIDNNLNPYYGYVGFGSDIF